MRNRFVLALAAVASILAMAYVASCHCGNPSPSFPLPQGEGQGEGNKGAPSAEPRASASGSAAASDLQPPVYSLRSSLTSSVTTDADFQAAILLRQLVLRSFSEGRGYGGQDRGLALRSPKGEAGYGIVEDTSASAGNVVEG